MRLLKEIKDDELPDKETGLKKREAARAILLDENELIPLLFVSKHGFHKLPGGGIESGESKDIALQRECLEEVGSQIEVKGEVGKIIEFRSRWNLRQTSYCYHGKIISKGRPDFTQKELDEGFQVVWLKLEEAIPTLEKDRPDNYEGTFVQQRDLTFLREFKKMQ